MTVKSLSQAFNCIVLIGTVMVVVYECMFLMSFLYLSSLLLLPLWKSLLYLFCLLILNFTYAYFIVLQVLQVLLNFVTFVLTVSPPDHKPV